MSDTITVTLEKGDSDETETIEVESLHYDEDSDDATVFYPDGDMAKIANATERVKGVMA